jgi:hypothetical protein
MTKRLKYRCVRRFEVQDLDIVEDLLDEDWMMAVVVRRGWTLALVFGVGWNDRDADRKD